MSLMGHEGLTLHEHLISLSELLGVCVNRVFVLFNCFFFLPNCVFLFLFCFYSGSSLFEYLSESGTFEIFLLFSK